MKILAVSSGKGGVGKTTLTLNIARQLSLAGFHTLIVDFDIHNKGATSLFLDSVASSTVQSVVGVIENCSSFEEESARQSAAQFTPLELNVQPDAGSRHTTARANDRGRMYLVPASRPDEIIQWERFVSEPHAIAAFFKAFIQSVGRAHRIDVVIIDCYGGIDRLTISAAGVADDFIILNEADVITFAGTLLLYKQLEAAYRESDIIPRIHFVISRVPGRYSFHFLAQTYREQLAPLAAEKAILAYLPFDKLVFDTFGEYPFFSELLPQGLYAKKIRELISRLWPEPQFVRMTSPSARKRRRIFEATAEQPFADPERIFYAWQIATGWASLPIAGLMLLYLLGQSGGHANTISFFTLRASFYMCLIFVSAVVVLAAVWEPIQVSRWLLRKAKYDRNKRRLIAGNRMTVPMRSAVEFVLSLVPGVIGLLCLVLIATVAVTVAEFPFFRNLAIWHGEIAGFAPHGNYRGTILASGARLRPDTDVSSSEFVNADLPGVRFPRAVLNGTKFDRATLHKTMLVGDSLEGSSFVDSDSQNLDVSASNASHAVFAESNLTGAHFWASVLAGADFENTRLYKCDFRQSTLRGAHFAGAIISPDTKFDGADLTGADLTKADFDAFELGKRDELVSRLFHQGATFSSEQLRLAAQWERNGGLLSDTKYQELERSKYSESEVSGWRSLPGPEPPRGKLWVDTTIAAFTKRLGIHVSREEPASGAKARTGADNDLVRLIESGDSETAATIANLVELLLIRRTPEDKRVARKGLDALLANTQRKGVQSPVENGAAYFFDAVLAIVNDDNVNQRVERWLSWLRDEGHGQLAGWEWDTFDANFNVHSILSPRQLTMIRVIRLSATGDLLTEDVAQWLSQSERSATAHNDARNNSRWHLR